MAKGNELPLKTSKANDCDKTGGGFHDVKFIDPPPDSLQCPICLLVLKEPHLLSCCGIHICEKCIGQIKTNGQPCPCCREEEYTTLLNKGMKSKILGLRVRCSEEDCDWEGELHDLEGHVSKKCLHVVEACPHGCGQSYSRRLLSAHQQNECPQRPLQIQLATVQRQFTQTYELLQQQLLEQQEKMSKQQQLLECLTQQEKTLQQQLLQQAKKYEKDTQKLQRQLVQQEKKHEEDMKQMKRQLVQQEKKHEEDKKQMKQQIVQQEKKLHQLMGTVLSVPLPVSAWVIPATTNTPPCYVAMNGFTHHKQNHVVWHSPPFYSHPKGYRMSLRVYANGHQDGTGTHVSVYIQICKGEHDNELTWPYRGTVTYEIVNWSGRNHKTQLVDFSSEVAIDGGCGNRNTTDKEHPCAWGQHHRILPHSELGNNSQFVYNDIMYFKVCSITV